MPSRDDELLAIRCQLGEPGAFDALVLRWHEPLQRYVRGLLPGDDLAADVLQEVWLGVLRGIARLQEPSALAPWMFSITRRAVMTRLRKRYAASVEVPIDTFDDFGAVSDTVDDSDTWASVERHLDQLPVVEREVLVLFYLKEMSLRDLAHVLDVPEGTVKSRLHRARKQLRSVIGEARS